MHLAARGTVAALLAVASLAAAAHTGHDSSGLMAGLAHPLGADHLLAVLAVGLWSAVAARGAQRLAAPAAFIAALLAGALAGHAGWMPPLAEQGIAASVALLGALLAAPRLLPRAAALAAIAAAGVLHGLAHGAEAGGGFAAYVAGLLLATAVLHGAGLALGAPLARWHAGVRQALAIALGLAGALLLAAA